MKKIIFAITAVAVLAAGALFVVGQIRAHRGEKGFGFGPGRGHMAGMMLRGLNLTDDQKGKIKSIFEATRTNVEPLRKALRENHEKLNAATAGGTMSSWRRSCHPTMGSSIQCVWAEPTLVRRRIAAGFGGITICWKPWLILNMRSTRR